MESAELALKLLISTSTEEARDLAQYLDGLNRKRQSLQNDYLNTAMEQVENKTTVPDKVIFVEKDDWQAGLIGLISGRLKENYARPAFAFTKDKNGDYVGSARSIEAFHVTNALFKFKDYFVTYGGHHKAAGLTVHADQYETFKAEFISYVDSVLDDENLVPVLEIDSVVDIDQISLNNVHMINEIGPFGETNSEPIFALFDVRIKEMMTLSNGRHLKFFLEKGNQVFEAVWWGSGENKDSVRLNDMVKVAFKMNANNWRGRERLQLVIEDIQTNGN